PTTGYDSGGDTTPKIVRRTDDGGVTWTDLPVEASGLALQGVGFVSEEVGWASGRGTTYETRNGGQTCAEVALDGYVNRFQFFGVSLGYAIGRRVYKYTATPVAVEPTPTDVDFRL